MRSTGSPSAEIDRLQERIAVLGALLDLSRHDLDRLFALLDEDEHFRRRLLRYVESGRRGLAQAMIRWTLR